MRGLMLGFVVFDLCLYKPIHYLEDPARRDTEGQHPAQQPQADLEAEDDKLLLLLHILVVAVLRVHIQLGAAPHEDQDVAGEADEAWPSEERLVRLLLLLGEC